MRNMTIAGGAIIAAAFFFSPTAALADGAEAPHGVRIHYGGADNASVAKRVTQNGVNIYRGGVPATAALDDDLAGADAAPEPASATKVVVVHHYHSRIRHLRTQGFYSGHPGKSRRFTQGFYSGPVDKGGRRY